MLFNLNVIDTLYAPLDVTSVLIESQGISLSSDVLGVPVGDTILLTTPLQAGNTYDIVFPVNGTVGDSSSVMTSTPADINVPLSSAFLQSGGTIQITPTVNITNLDFAGLVTVPVAGTPVAITSLLNTFDFVVMTTPAPHGLSIGETFFIAGTTPAMETGSHVVLFTPTATTVTFAAAGSSNGDASVGGTFALADFTSAYNSNIDIRGEDITITIDWVDPLLVPGSQVFTGTNLVTDLVIPDGSTVDITVTSGILVTYTNTIRVYSNEVFASALMMPLITNPLDPAFRQPFPNFFTIIEPCTFNVHIYDGQNAPFGLINYYVNEDLVSSGQRNYILDTCIADIVTIGQEIVVREVANCGGASPVIFDRNTIPASWFEILGIQTVAFLPEFQLDNEFRCCVALDDEIILAPELINMNAVAPHDLVCDVTTDPGVSLNYSLLTPALAIVDLGSYTAAEIDAGPLLDLNAAFTPDELGTYILTVTLTNCCGSTVHTYDINICDSWQITNTDCNKVVITNISSSLTLTYVLAELTDNDIFEVMTVDAVLQDAIVVTPNTTVTLDLVNDGLYTFDLITSAPGDTEQEKIFLIDCNIKQCKKDFLLAVTCPPAACDDLAKLQLWRDYVHFKTLEEIVYYRWDEWVRQQSVFPSFSINDIMENVLSINDVIKDLAKLCGNCGIKEEDCGCS